MHHVGVAVRSLEEALATYVEDLGFSQVGEPVEVPSEHVRICFVRAADGPLVELVEGLDDASPVRAFVERTGGGAYHICYVVDDLDRTVRALRRQRCFPFRRFEVSCPEPRRFAFLLSPQRELFELIESTSNATELEA